MRPPSPEIMKTWTPEPLSEAVRKLLERLCGSEGVARVAVMPDVHLGPEVCNGVAVGTEDVVYPAAVGRDIGCGVSALRLDVPEPLVDHTAARLLEGLDRFVPAIKHRGAPPLPGDLGPPPSSMLRSRARREGRIQFGTLGRGNHFLELQREPFNGATWLMVHSGSRAMGQAISAHHLKGASRSRSGLGMLEADTARGQAYLADAAWAVSWASASRRRMLDVACALLHQIVGAEPDEDSFVDCCHNLVQSESIAGRPLWVHRKGALPATEGLPGLIPGSMGTESYHVVGRGEPEALCSSSHGAGRALSRTEARKSVSVRKLVQQMGAVWFDRRLSARLVEEAPGAYKNVRTVMKVQSELTDVVRSVRPLLVYKGG